MRLENKIIKESMVIEDDMLIRKIQIGSDWEITTERRECVITKDEFLACYNAWVKNEEEK